MSENQKVVIVTGASRGLGAAAARIAAEYGAAVVLTARSREELEREFGAIRAAGGEALVVEGDLTQRADCERVIDRTLEQYGQIDGLINNSGIIGPIAPISEAEAEGWMQNWTINVLAPVLLTRLALPALRQRGGRIVNVSSGAAVRPTQGWGAYSASKAAINQLTQVLAREEPGITALAVRPGMVDTGMQKEIRELGAVGMPESEHQRFVGAHEQGELLPPEQPGRALAVLALYAPHAWSGEFISWDESRVQELVYSQG